MKLSEIFGKKVQSADGSLTGYVRSVFISGDKLEYLACADGEEREFDVDVRDVIDFGAVIIFTDRRRIKARCLSLRLGVPLFSQDGKFIGNINEVYADKNKLTAYYAANKRFLPQELVLGDVALKSTAGRVKNAVKAANGNGGNGGSGGNGDSGGNVGSGGKLLKEDVISGDKVILKKGTPLNGAALARAQSAGEYVQAQLKSI